MKEKVNNALQNHLNIELRKRQIIAVKRHPSGDLTLFTPVRESTNYLIAQRNEWQSTLGERAEVKLPSYGILVHGVSTQVEAHNKVEIEERIQWNNPSLENAKVTYSGWLKRDLGEKRASTMVVEFDREEDADHAILNGIVFGAQIFACEYYDRACKARQCFKCQKYGHIGTHCKAQGICGYCAGLHSTKVCPERERPNSQAACPKCLKSHPSWSVQCQHRKEEFARIEERKRHMPKTHREAALRWGNYTGKPFEPRELPQARRENRSRGRIGEVFILSTPEIQKRKGSSRKSLRLTASQGQGDATREALQELDRNTLPTPRAGETARNKRRALDADSTATAPQDSVMSIVPLDE